MTERSEAKATTHRRIVASASKLVRRQGLNAASVVRVMRGAGLTVGGFYAHFRSKRAMDVEVLRQALGNTRRTWLGGLEDSDGLDWLSRAVKRYLAPEHRDQPDDGCPMPSVLSELARADKTTRQPLVDAFEIAAGEFAQRAPERAGITPRERALATLALCIGGLALARALRGHPVSDELIRACRKWALPEARARRA
jgi:TetR/AcrR family transcriptional repressor of nem operon